MKGKVRFKPDLFLFYEQDSESDRFRAREFCRVFLANSCSGSKNLNPCRNTLRFATIALIVTRVRGSLILSSTSSPSFSSTGRIADIPHSLISSARLGMNSEAVRTITSASISRRGWSLLFFYAHADIRMVRRIDVVRSFDVMNLQNPNRV